MNPNLKRSPLLGVVHLERMHGRVLAARGSEPFERFENEVSCDRVLLAGLGIAIESTFRYLSDVQPTLGEFESWILEKNEGHIDPLGIERINCALAGVPYPKEVDNYLQDITFDDDVLGAEDFDFWEEHGFVVVREAVPRDKALETEQAVWDFLGMSANDITSWYSKPIGKGIMTDFYYSHLLSENRRSRRLHKAFSQLWNTADLWVTADRTSFNPPETPDHQYQGPRLHWDMSLAPPFQFGTQGLLYLCDTTEEQGAFQCVPGFHRTLGPWLEDLPKGTNPRRVDLDDRAVSIAGRAGDLVIWHQALPHGSSPNRGNYPRIVQYINMFPLCFKENLNWV